jgi:PAS domain S-box-containing protein
MWWDSEPSTLQIGLDVARDRNRELLTGLFEDADVVEFAEAVPQEMDLCLIDRAALERNRERFADWHDRQTPVFAPVVLLAEDSARNPWQVFGSSLSEYVDSVLTIPMPKTELRARVRNLLRMRRFSQELAEEQQLRQLIFESSPVGKFVLELDGTIVQANERAAEMFDTEPSALVGARYLDESRTPRREDGTEITDAERPLTTVVETGQSVYGVEHRIEHSEADDIWVLASMAPIRDDSGTVEYIVAILEDITVRKRQGRELERQVDLFSRAQEIADIGAWEYDDTTGDYWVTEQVYRIFGLTADAELSPVESLPYYHPEDRETIRNAYWRAVDHRESFDHELRIVRPDGEQRWIHVRGEPQLDDGAVEYVRGTIQDITDRKRRDAELRRMQNAVDNAPIGITLSDPSQPDNPLIYVNDGFVEQTGYAREEAVGRNCRFLQGDDTDQQTVARLRRAIDAEESVSVTIRNYRADGSGYWNYLEIAPVRGEDGDVVNFIGFQQDVTDLIERRRQLQLLGRYLRHNLRNSMNVVQGYAAAIEAEADPHLAEYAEKIVGRASKLMDDVEAERTITTLLQSESTPTTIEVIALLRTVTDECAETYPEASVTVSGPDEATVRAIPDLKAALEELVRNALEHNDADAPEVRVDVDGDAGEEVVAVQVADNGPQIPEMEVDVLADAETETPVYHGQGLGLWLVYVIVQHSGGHLSFGESSLGGNLVTVELPRGDDD